ncbi:hypothetical protein [Castellaniella sp.]|uniref:hypothetical protein n=1 Tax=Castellaniella sp. TaxID=1955812 RepID=UPI003C755D74
MSKPEIQCDQSMFERLTNISAADIDGLVDILTDFGRGRASLDADIKKTLVMARHDPRLNRYSEQHIRTIANEVQHYGGHSVANLIRDLRDKPPLSYESIVNNVHAKLNGKDTEAKSVETKECEIALALYGPPSDALPLETRIEHSTTMKVLSGFFHIEESSTIKEFLLKGGLLAGFAPLLSSPKSLMSLGKLGLRANLIALLTSSVAFAGEKLSAEAYRVTVPFVAEMGWIRLQTANRRKTAGDSTSPAGKPKATVAAKGSTPTPNEADIVLANEQGSTLMTFSRFDEDVPTIANTKAPKQVISTLNPLLQSFPQIASLAEQQRGNYVLCTIPFESLVKATNGPEGARRAFVMGAKGVQEQAHILAPETLQSVMISGVAWNALSAAVGQKHLQDINEKLNTIQEQLDQLGDSLKDLRRDKLEGMMDYVQGLLDNHQEEGTSELALIQLEGYLAELKSLDSFFKKEMKRELQKAESLQTGKLLGGGTVRDLIADGVVSMRRWLQCYFQTAQLHIITLWLLNNSAPSARYRTAAEGVLNRLGELDDTILDSRKVYSAQMAMASSVGALPQEQVTAFDKLLQSLSQNNDTGRLDTTAWHQRLFHQAGTSMLLRVENGDIQEASFVERRVGSA